MVTINRQISGAVVVGKDLQVSTTWYGGVLTINKNRKK